MVNLTDLKRYDLVQYESALEENIGGEWVRFEDVENILNTFPSRDVDNMKQILNILRIELSHLKKICDKQFEERFATVHHEDKWADNLFREYQTCIIKIDSFNDMLLK